MSVFVCFGTQHNFKSWLIRKVTASPYSHAWVEYDSSMWSMRMVVHAQPTGIMIETAANVHKEYIIKKRYRFIHVGAERGLKRCKKYLGKPYDFKAVLTNGLLLVLYRLIPIKRFQDWLWSKTVKDHSKYSCTEFAALMMKNSGYVKARGLDEETVTPGELAAFCQSSAAFTEEKV